MTERILLQPSPRLYELIAAFSAAAVMVMMMVTIPLYKALYKAL